MNRKRTKPSGFLQQKSSTEKSVRYNLTEPKELHIHFARSLPFSLRKDSARKVENH